MDEIARFRATVNGTAYSLTSDLHAVPDCWALVRDVYRRCLQGWYSPLSVGALGTVEAPQWDGKKAVQWWGQIEAAGARVWKHDGYEILRVQTSSWLTLDLVKSDQGNEPAGFFPGGIFCTDPWLPTGGPGSGYQVLLSPGPGLGTGTAQTGLGHPYREVGGAPNATFVLPEPVWSFLYEWCRVAGIEAGRCGAMPIPYMAAAASGMYTMNGQPGHWCWGSYRRDLTKGKDVKALYEHRTAFHHEPDRTGCHMIWAIQPLMIEMGELRAGLYEWENAWKAAGSPVGTSQAAAYWRGRLQMQLSYRLGKCPGWFIQDGQTMPTWESWDGSRRPFYGVVVVFTKGRGLRIDWNEWIGVRRKEKRGLTVAAANRTFEGSEGLEPAHRVEWDGSLRGLLRYLELEDFLSLRDAARVQEAWRTIPDLEKGWEDYWRQSGGWKAWRKFVAKEVKNLIDIGVRPGVKTTPWRVDPTSAEEPVQLDLTALDRFEEWPVRKDLVTQSSNDNKVETRARAMIRELGALSNMINCWSHVRQTKPHTVVMMQVLFARWVRSQRHSPIVDWGELRDRWVPRWKEWVQSKEWEAWAVGEQNELLGGISTKRWGDTDWRKAYQAPINRVTPLPYQKWRGVHWMNVPEVPESEKSAWEGETFEWRPDPSAPDRLEVLVPVSLPADQTPSAFKPPALPPRPTPPPEEEEEGEEEARTCPCCEHELYDDDTSYCDECQSDVCFDCVNWCVTCDRHVCASCRQDMGAFCSHHHCGEYVCEGHRHYCETCGNDYCRDHWDAELEMCMGCAELAEERERLEQAEAEEAEREEGENEDAVTQETTHEQSE